MLVSGWWSQDAVAAQQEVAGYRALAVGLRVRTAGRRAGGGPGALAQTVYH